MKILVIQHKMIGDVLTSSILFEALKKKHPEAELHYLIQAHTKPVVKNNPYIDAFLVFTPKKDSLISIAKRVRNEKYDIIIDAYSKINSAFITALSGARSRISYHKKYTSAAYSLTFKPAPTAKTNAGLAIENRMLLLQGISKDFPVHIKPKVYLTDKEKELAREFLLEKGLDLDRSIIMVSILGSSPSKTYPIEYLAKVLDHVVADCQPQLLFNYIPCQSKEAEALYGSCSPQTRNHIFPQAFGHSLRDFIAITSQCDALVGNEGGAVNIAKALDLPTFSIFSPRVKREVWSTYEDNIHQVSVHVEDHLPLQDLYLLEKGTNDSVFYKKFEPELFLDKIKMFLKNSLTNRMKTIA